MSRVDGAPVGWPRRVDYDVVETGVLTAFERRVLVMFAAGLPRGEIALALKRAPKTISNSLTAAKEKLGARSLAEATALLAAEAIVIANGIS